jgi:hypothetical protein
MLTTCKAYIKLIPPSHTHTHIHFVPRNVKLGCHLTHNLHNIPLHLVTIACLFPFCMYLLLFPHYRGYFQLCVLALSKLHIPMFIWFSHFVYWESPIIYLSFPLWSHSLHLTSPLSTSSFLGPFKVNKIEH